MGILETFPGDVSTGYRAEIGDGRFPSGGGSSWKPRVTRQIVAEITRGDGSAEPAESAIRSREKAPDLTKLRALARPETGGVGKMDPRINGGQRCGTAWPRVEGRPWFIALMFILQLGCKANRQPRWTHD